MKESAVEAHLVAAVKRRGGMTLKLDPRGSGQNHWPDRLVVDPIFGTFFAELKRPKGGRLSEGQKERHAQIREAGGRVKLLWTKDMVDDLFR